MSAPTRQELIFHWRSAKSALVRAKLNEMRWRMRIALDPTIFAKPELGSNKSGDLTLTCKETFSLSKDTEALEKCLFELAEIYHVAVDTLVNYAPSISQSAYAALSQEAKAHLATVLTIKAATPSLALKGFKAGEDDE
jgi:hypothetical protein